MNEIEQKKEMGGQYIAAIDTLFIENNELGKKAALKANNASETLFGESNDFVRTYLSRGIVEQIKFRLPDEKVRGELLRAYKEMLEVKFGIVKANDETDKNNMIEKGESAAEILFLVKKPKFSFQ